MTTTDVRLMGQLLRTDVQIPPKCVCSLKVLKKQAGPPIDVKNDNIFPEAVAGEILTENEKIALIARAKDVDEEVVECVGIGPIKCHQIRKFDRLSGEVKYEWTVKGTKYQARLTEGFVWKPVEEIPEQKFTGSAVLYKPPELDYSVDWKSGYNNVVEEIIKEKVELEITLIIDGLDVGERYERNTKVIIEKLEWAKYKRDVSIEREKNIPGYSINELDLSCGCVITVDFPKVLNEPSNAEITEMNIPEHICYNNPVILSAESTDTDIEEIKCEASWCISKS